MSNWVRWEGLNFEEVERFAGGDAEFREGQLLVATPSGARWLKVGQYLIRLQSGEFVVSSERPE